MRRRRIIGKPGSSYHVISRFVDKQFALGEDKAKRVFLDILLSQAKFSGVEILTYCLMGNHFHLLIRIPEAPELTEAVVLKRLSAIWSAKRLKGFREHLAKLREISVQGEELAQRELDRQRKRMHHLSEFAKDVKQRFSIWFNRAHERKGTLFEERFKSVLVESGQALRMMAAYIELNPVRAGLVDDPALYPWCGYAQALGGNQARQHGIRQILTDPRDRRTAAWPGLAKRYRLWLVDRGMETKHRDGRAKKQGFSRADAIAAWQSEGEVPMATLLRCKTRYLSDSLIYGSKRFIEEFIEAHRDVLGAYPKAHETGTPSPTGSPCNPASNPPPELCSLARLRGPALE